MDRFRVEVISKTPNPQQTIYAAMHQDYAEGFVYDEREHWPDEEKAGEVIVKRLLAGERGHYGPLEHCQIVFNVGYFPHSVMQQARTHRIASFDVQCLAGDTEVTFVQASGGLRRIPIAELYELWTNGEQAVRERKLRGRQGEGPGSYRRDCKARLKKMRLRVLNEETGSFEIGHLQDVMCSGIQPVYRLTLADGKTLDCTTNHRLYTSEGWQRMGDALGLVVDANHQVRGTTRSCELMTNGVVRSDAPYTRQDWLQARIDEGMTARAIAQACGCSEQAIRRWAKQFQLQLPSARHRGLKTVVGNGLYRNREWLETQLNQGLHADEMAGLAGCSVESVKKWVYAHGLSLNKRSPGPEFPWNRGVKGYRLNLSEERREQRRAHGRAVTRRGAESNFWKGGTASDRDLIGAWTRQIAPQVHARYDYTCQNCHQVGGNLHAHHLIPVYANPALAYDFSNLVSLCKACHEHLHSNRLEAEFASRFQPLPADADRSWETRPKAGLKLKAHPVPVVSVEYLGLQTTYDLEVQGPWHNFVANGVVVHNSMRYTGARVAAAARGEVDLEDVFYLRPVGHYHDRQGHKYHYSPELRAADLELCRQAAQRYCELTEAGFSEEHARGILPFDYRQHFVVSFNLRSALHFMDLRSKKDAQLEIQKVCDLMWPHIQAWVPAVANWYEQTRLGKARLAP